MSGAAGLAALAAALVGAPEAPLEGHALALSASPNQATLRYQWRGMVGVDLPVVESSTTPWVLVLSPLLESANGPTSAAPVPFELWRGRASLELGYRFVLDDAPDRRALRLSVLLTHESAHETVQASAFVIVPSTRTSAQVLVSPSAQVHTNDVGLRLLATQTFGDTLLGLVLTQRLHFASCTVRARGCDDVRPGFGLETELDVVVEGLALDATRWLRPYAALSAQVIPAIQDMGLEGRVVVEAGATLDPGRLGRFRVFGALVAGHEPGLLRERAVVYGGAGVAFSFF